MLQQLEQKDVKPLREKWLKQQGGKCLITGTTITLKDATLDHLHKLKSELADETGKGCCRGVLHHRANSWEGRVTKAYSRSGLKTYITLTEALRNLASYLENNRIHQEVKYIHPSEKPKKSVLTKTSYNALKKISKEKLPAYGKGFFNVKIKESFKKYKLEPKFYSNDKSK